MSDAEQLEIQGAAASFQTHLPGEPEESWPCWQLLLKAINIEKVALSLFLISIQTEQTHPWPIANKNCNLNALGTLFYKEIKAV